MSLLGKTVKQITLTNNVLVEGKNVVNLSATIPSETGVANINKYTNDFELYNANKQGVREAIAEFTAEVYEIEDEMAAEVTE